MKKLSVADKNGFTFLNPYSMPNWWTMFYITSGLYIESKYLSEINKYLLFL